MLHIVFFETGEYDADIKHPVAICASEDIAELLVKQCNKILDSHRLYSKNMKFDEFDQRNYSEATRQLRELLGKPHFPLLDYDGGSFYVHHETFELL